MREKLYPVDQLSVKEEVSCFGWEPTGNRFAYLATTSTGSITIHIHELMKNGKVREVAALVRGNARLDMLQWSPKGNIFVVANLNK